MPRAALTLLLALLAAGPAAAQGLDPHMDPDRVPGSCRACHESHGASRSPMLPGPQSAVCLGCHGTQADLARRVEEGLLAADVRPHLLETTLSQGFTHPLTAGAHSRHDEGAVTCTSCHSPHRRLPRDLEAGGVSGRRLASNDPNRFEYELCGECHGRSDGPGRRRRSAGWLEGGSLLDPSNRSFHPVEAPAVERSPSVGAKRRGDHINCTDCHANSDPDGPQGPHGSGVQYLLGLAYATTDGREEGTEAYGLCYSCHDRDVVLEQSPFPLHSLHVVGLRASCATCHSAHGSFENRSLIRFGEETILAGVAPSAATGRLAFESSAPGSGSCYLTCHGFDHAPESYGGLALANELLQSIDVLAPAPSAEPAWPGDRLGPGRLRPRRPPPP